MSRVILHIDMDSFFCSVERALNPLLEGKPLMVGGSPSGRGVVVAATYDVKAKGVRQGMPAARAVRLAPEAIILPSRHPIYTQISAGILGVLSTFTSAIEPASIDESYLDVSDVSGGFSGAARIGLRIRSAIRDRYHLPASVGIGPSRAVAKIASVHAKPDGIQVIPPERMRSFLDPLPVSNLGGVGPKSAETLSNLGIRTIGDLITAGEKRLVRLFGEKGATLFRRALGEEITPIVAWYESADPKSMSNETTLAADTEDGDTLGAALLWLSEKLAARIRSAGFLGKVFTMKIRFSDFTTIDKRRTLTVPTDDEKTIYSMAKRTLRLHRKGRKVRLVGVGLSGLRRRTSVQEEFGFDRGRSRRLRSIEVFDAVRRRFGREKLKKARLL